MSASRVRSRRFGAMGSWAEITIVGDASRQVLTRAVERLDQLERRWSRFIETSEVCQLTFGAGHPVGVSDDTILLVELALEGWRRTEARYDPTVLAAVCAIGYTVDFNSQLRSCASLGTFRRGSSAASSSTSRHADNPAFGADPPPDHRGAGSIVVDRAANTVTLPEGHGFDPGGIGKGLAADLVSAQLAHTGVVGGCVNVGGDLRIWGQGPENRPWRIAAADRTIETTDVGIATSGLRNRSWVFEGRAVHHLIDPTTQRPSNNDIVSATVIAPSAWRAEVHATAVMSTTSVDACGDLERWGLEGLVVGSDGQSRTTGRVASPT